jgi:hypothetical protein
MGDGLLVGKDFEQLGNGTVNVSRIHTHTRVQRLSLDLDLYITDCCLSSLSVLGSDDNHKAIMREGCTASNETVNGFRALTIVARSTGRRLVAQCHFGHPTYLPPLNDTIAEDTAAAFLCGAGERSD